MNRGASASQSSSRRWPSLLLGVTCCVSLGLAPARAGTGPGTGGEIDVEVTLSLLGSPADGLLTLRATPVASTGESTPQLVEVAATLPGRHDLRLRAGTVWRLEPVGPGIWGVSAQVGPEPGAARAEIVVFPTGSVNLELEGGRPDLHLPATLPVRLRPTGPRPPFSTATVHCPVEGRRVECEVPAIPLDLRVKVPGHAGIFLWQVRTEPKQSVSLGRRTLIPGGSIVGSVVRERDDRTMAEVEVRVEVESSTGAISRELIEAQRGLPATRTDARGFFQLVGLEPAGYRVLAAGADGARAEQGGLQLPRDAEIEISRPLRAAAPATLAVQVRPAVPPTRGRWQVEARRFDTPGHMTTVAQVAGDESGKATIPGLSAGRYLLTALDAEGSRSAYREVSIPEELEVELEVPMLEVEGIVTLGDEPLAADLWFGGRTGGRRVLLQADDTGRFQGFLPEQERYRVDVEAAAVSVRRRMEGVRAWRPLDGGPARIVLRLPDTRVAGRVSTPSGRPAASAVVNVAVPGENTAFFSKSDDGKFVFRGLDTGTIRLSASGRLESGERGDAPPIDLVLSKEVTRPREVELVLRAMRALSGRVVDLQGEPVAGALLKIAPLAAGRAVSSGLESASTGLDGRFEVNLPGEASELIVFLGARGGGALRALRVAIPGERELTLVTAHQGGELELRLEGGLVLDDPKGTVPIVFQDGIPLHLSVLFTWIQAHGIAVTGGPELFVPNLAAGRIAVCLLDFEQLTRLDASPGSFAPSPSCASGDLSPGGRLVLEP